MNKEEIKTEDLHFVGTFMGRNLYLETPDKGIVEMFSDFTAAQEEINRLYQQIKTNQEMMNFSKIFNPNPHE